MELPIHVLIMFMSISPVFVVPADGKCEYDKLNQ